jgi:hypothetical protein
MGQPTPEPTLFTKVMLALLSGQPVTEFLDAQRERRLAVMRELTAARRGASLQDALRADFQLFLLVADMRWIDHATGLLDTPPTIRL